MPIRFIQVATRSRPAVKPPEKTLHYPAACERIVHVQLVDTVHQFQVIIADRARLIIKTAQADPEQISLAREAQLVISIGHFFAFPNRPALASASRKKSFSSVSWPIFACNDLTSISGSFDALGLSSMTSVTPSRSWSFLC
jgi:hypothetical protein